MAIGQQIWLGNVRAQVAARPAHQSAFLAPRISLAHSWVLALGLLPGEAADRPGRLGVWLGVDGPRQLLPVTLQNVLTAVVPDELATAVEAVSLGAAVFVDDPWGELTIARRVAHASWCPKDGDHGSGNHRTGLNRWFRTLW